MSAIHSVIVQVIETRFGCQHGYADIAKNLEVAVVSPRAGHETQ